MNQTDIRNENITGCVRHRGVVGDISFPSRDHGGDSLRCCTLYCPAVGALPLEGHGRLPAPRIYHYCRRR